MQVPKFREMVASLCQVIRLRLFLIITIENVTGGLGLFSTLVCAHCHAQRRRPSTYTENLLGRVGRLANSALFVYRLPIRVFPSGRREEGGLG
jgi:hypothetical protein